MKKLLLILFVFAALQVSAQDTYTIMWGFGSNPMDQSPGDPQYSDLTVEVGDTVNWVWTGSGTHNILTFDGSTESFGFTQRVGMPNTFSYTFMLEGSNPYRCTPHAGSMNGTITVVPDGTLSSQDVFRENLSSFPNPVQDELTITSLVNMSSIEVYSILGKKVLSQSADSGTLTNIKMGNLQTGLYFVNVTAENGETSVLRVMKK